MIAVKEMPAKCSFCGGKLVQKQKKVYSRKKNNVLLRLKICDWCGTEYCTLDELYGAGLTQNEIEELQKEDLEDMKIHEELKGCELKNRVEEERKKRDLTQRELARRIGKPPQRLVEIEKGKYTPGVDVALKIARALKCSVEDLFCLLKKENKNENQSVGGDADDKGGTQQNQ